MACLFNLRDRLTGNPSSGGTWTETSTTNPSYQAQGGTITNGDLGTVDFTGFNPGSYTFDYTIATGPCSGTSTVTVELLARAEAGSDFNDSFCSTDTTEYVLYDQLGTTPLPDTDGVWSGTGVFSAGYNSQGAGPTNDTFQPSLVATGNYTFIYTVDHNTANTPANCENCKDTATITFSIVDTPKPGVSATVTACA